MVSDKQIDLAIDKTHLRDSEKIHPHVVKKYPGVSLKRVEHVNETRPKIVIPTKKNDIIIPYFRIIHIVFKSIY